MKKLNFIFLLLPLIYASCNSRDDSREQYIAKLEKENSEMASKLQKQSSTDTIYQPVIPTKNVETIQYKPTLYELKQYSALKKIKTYPQFLRTYFFKGSTMEEVQHVQGFPDDKVNPSIIKEVWFYGSCEITFENGLITDITNQEGCLRYIDITNCLYAKDSEVQRIAAKIVSESVKGKSH